MLIWGQIITALFFRNRNYSWISGMSANMSNLVRCRVSNDYEQTSQQENKLIAPGFYSTTTSH